jgi:hypothetical protein
LLAVRLSICFVVAIDSFYFMRILANRRLPPRAKFPDLHPFTFDLERLNRVIDRSSVSLRSRLPDLESSGNRHGSVRRGNRSGGAMGTGGDRIV